MKQVCSSKDLYINSNYIKHHIGNNHFTGQQQIVEYLKQVRLDVQKTYLQEKL